MYNRVGGFHSLRENVIKSRLDATFVSQEIGDSRLAPEREVHAVEIPGPHSGERERRFSQCFARNGTSICASPAKLRMLIDNGYRLAEGGGRGSANDSRRTAAYDDQVKS